MCYIDILTYTGLTRPKGLHFPEVEFAGQRMPVISNIKLAEWMQYLIQQNVLRSIINYPYILGPTVIEQCTKHCKQDVEIKTN